MNLLNLMNKEDNIFHCSYKYSTLRIEVPPNLRKNVIIWCQLKLRLCLVIIKFKGKYEEKKIKRKSEKKIKLINYFYLFL